MHYYVLWLSVTLTTLHSQQLRNRCLVLLQMGCTCFGIHSVSYSMGNGAVSTGVSSGSVKLTTLPILSAEVKNGWLYTSTTFTACTGTTLQETGKLYSGSCSSKLLTS